MRTKLFGKSNAILVNVSEDINPIAIIECGKDEEIKAKLDNAIRDEFVLGDEVELTFDSDDLVLTNQETVKFSVSYEDEGEPCIRDFEIGIVATY